MKRSILLLIIANLSLAIIIYLSFEKRNKKTEDLESLIVETISNLDEISIDQPESNLSLVIKKENQIWQLISPVFWPVEQLVYSNFTTKLAHLKPEKIASMVEIENRGEIISDYGIDENSTRLKLKGNTNSIDISIGNLTRDEESVFIHVAPVATLKESIWKVSRELEEIALADSAKWAITTFIETPFSGIDKFGVKFYSDNNSSSETSLVKDLDNWIFDQPFKAEANPNKVSSLLNKILSFKIEGFASRINEDEINQELAIELSINGSIGRELFSFFSAKNPEDDYFIVSKNTSKTKFIIEQSIIEFLSDWSSRLRERKILSLGTKQIDFIEFGSEIESLKLDMLRNDKWTSTESNETDNETIFADSDTVAGLLQSLNQIEVDKFLLFNPSENEKYAFLGNDNKLHVRIKFIDTTEFNLYLIKSSDDTSLWKSYIPEKKLICLLKLPWTQLPAFNNITFRDRNLIEEDILSIALNSTDQNNSLLKNDLSIDRIYPFKASNYIDASFSSEGAWVNGDWVPWKYVVSLQLKNDKVEQFYLSEQKGGTTWYGGSLSNELIFNLDSSTIEWLSSNMQSANKEGMP